MAGGSRWRSVLWVTLCALAVLAVAPVGGRAETVVQAWRSPFGTPHSVSVNTADGSIWSISGAWVQHIAADGDPLYRTDRFPRPYSVSVNSANASVYVGLAGPWGEFGAGGTVICLDPNGSERWRQPFPGLPLVAASPADDSVWVGRAPWPSGWAETTGTLAHLSASGATLWTGEYGGGINSLSVNPSDGSCWGSSGILGLDTGLVHLSASGGVLGETSEAGHPSVNSTDGSCWATFIDDPWALAQQLTRLDSDCSVLLPPFTPAEFTEITSFSTSSFDGSVWACDIRQGIVVHLDAQGQEMWRWDDAYFPSAVYASPADASCWVAVRDGLVHIDAAGDIVWWGQSMPYPASVSVDTADGSCWVAAPDPPYSHVLHQAADGSVLWDGGYTTAPWLVSTNPLDGSCWVIDGAAWPTEWAATSPVLFKLSASGTPLGEAVSVASPGVMAVSPADGSVWVIDGDSVVHLAADGVELHREAALLHPSVLAVDGGDGSCWVGGQLNGDPVVVRLDATGAALWPPQVTSFTLGMSPYSMSASAFDHSCWATYPAYTSGGVGFWGFPFYHFAADGSVLLGAGEAHFSAVAANPMDGTVWATDAYQGQVVHLAPDGSELWRGGSFRWPGMESPSTVVNEIDGVLLNALAVDPYDGSCWVVDTSNGQLVHLGVVPDADFTGSPREGAAPLLVTFTDLSTGYPTSWLWSFGDGTTSAQRNPTHQYATAGAYAVSLTARNAYGADTEIRDDYIIVTARLDADFAASPRSGPAPLTVTFTDMSTGGPTSWLWQFGDGGTSDVQNPTHTYLAAGSYPVSLTVGRNGVSDTETKIDDIIVGPTPPVLDAEFIGAPTTGPAPLTVYFADQSLGGPTEWEWDFGDGATSMEQNPTHIYTSIGVFTVSLHVENATSADTETKPNYVLVTPPPAPMANFEGEPTSGDAPLEVHFTDESTGMPTAWLWEFGDDATSTEENPNHTYLHAGSYSVTLTATNAGGSHRITKEGYILVTAPPAPEAHFAAMPTQGEAPMQVDFDDESTGEPTSWLWSFGDGATTMEQNPTHVYGRAGRYDVSLTVSGAGGSNTDVKSHYILVTFPDVPFEPEFWALHEILSCVEAGVVQGYENGDYGPNDLVSRDQMAVYIARALAGGDTAIPSGPAVATFEDVPNSGYGENGEEPYWAYKYIEYCFSHRVVEGYSATRYEPLIIVDRGQMAAFVARARAWVDIDDDMATAPEVFPDVPAGYWSGTAVEACVGHGVVRGYQDGLYHPEYQVDRGQMAVYIQRAWGLTM